MPLQLAFDLPGNWTSSRILVRLLMVVQSPWMPDEEGFVHLTTGERAQLLMYRPAPGLAEAFAEGVCPIRPTVDDALLAEIAEHKAIVRVMAAAGTSGPRAALTLLRATNAIVNGGALAVRCATSGLAHGADAVAPLLDRAEAVVGASDPELADALFDAFVFVSAEARRTFGMAALGAPDVALSPGVATDPDAAVITLEDRARELLRSGPGERVSAPDPVTRADPRHNPLGIVQVGAGRA